MGINHYNDLRTLAACDRKGFYRVKKEMDKESRAMTEGLRVIFAQDTKSENDGPMKVWRSRKFLVQLFNQNGHARLSINRAQVNSNGEWLDGITWDELMELKHQAGYGACCAVEVFPPDDHVVNVANMRHLFLLPNVPDYVWKPENKKSD